MAGQPPLAMLYKLRVYMHCGLVNVRERLAECVYSWVCVLCASWR